MEHIRLEEEGHPVEDSLDRSNLVQTYCCYICWCIVVVSLRDPQGLYVDLSRSRGKSGQNELWDQKTLAGTVLLIKWIRP